MDGFQTVGLRTLYMVSRFELHPSTSRLLTISQWSPSLVPKPQDWGPEIDIAGFVFLELASSFKPPEALTKFLDAGPPPIYIGFGSIAVDDPDKLTQLIFEAVGITGVRALVSDGWGGLGD